MKRSISFRPTLLALVLATNFPVAHAAVPKDMLVIGKAADPQTLHDPAVTIDNNDWTVTCRLISDWFSTKRTVIKAQQTLKAIWQVAGKRLTIKKVDVHPEG